MSRIYIRLNIPEYEEIQNLKTNKITKLIEKAILEKKLFDPMLLLKIEEDDDFDKKTSKPKRISIKDKNINKMLGLFNLKARNLYIRMSLIEYLERQKNPIKNKITKNENIELFKQIEGDLT